MIILATILFLSLDGEWMKRPMKSTGSCETAGERPGEKRDGSELLHPSILTEEEISTTWGSREIACSPIRTLVISTRKIVGDTVNFLRGLKY